METAVWVLVFVGVCNLIVSWVGVNDQHKNFAALHKRLIEIQNHLADINTSSLNHWLHASTGKDQFTDEPEGWRDNHV